jgi:hypothetical protein
MSQQMKFSTAETYDAVEDPGHYVKVFNDDHRDHNLTVLVRDDKWQPNGNGNDRLVYNACAVAISKEDAVRLANWILENFTAST